MSVWKKYLEAEISYLREIEKTQGNQIMEAAKLCAKTTMNDGIIRVFGVGHSHLIADDVFYRSATLGNVQAILEETTTGNSEITKSGSVEKIEGYAEIIFNYHRIQKEDVVIAISNSGNNQVSLEFARYARSQNIPVIVLTNTEYSDYLNARHSSGTRLKDHGDVVISNCTPIGDAAIEMPGLPMRVGSTSSIPFIFLINAILAEAVAICLENDFVPDVYYNGSLRANNPAIGDHNFAIIDKYFYRMKNL